MDDKPAAPLTTATNANEPGRQLPAARLLRGLLLSDYFMLYLTVAYFLGMAVFFPALVEPRNLSNQLSNLWPLLAVAIGRWRPQRPCW